MKTQMVTVFIDLFSFYFSLYHLFYLFSPLDLHNYSMSMFLIVIIYLCKALWSTLVLNVLYK